MDTVKQESRTKQRMIDDDRDDRKQLIAGAGSLVGKSISTIEYLTKHMNSAPVLKPIEDMTIIQKSEGNGEFEVADIAMYHCKKNTLHKYIGNIIIAYYKEEDNPGQQSIWTTDVARLSYVIRQNAGKNEIWVEDKSGLKVKETIIVPMLEYMSKSLQKKLNSTGEASTKEDLERIGDMTDVLQKIGSLQNKKQISTLAQQVNRYIAGHFYLDRPRGLLK